VKVGDLVEVTTLHGRCKNGRTGLIENFEGLGVVTKDPYPYKTMGGYAYDVVLVTFFQDGDTFEVDCDELKVISESR